MQRQDHTLPKPKSVSLAQTDKVVYMICALWFLVMVTCAWLHAPRNRLLLVLPMAIFAGAFITSVVRIFTQGERLKDRAAIPAVVCVATAVLTILVTPKVFKAGFGRVLPRYMAIVNQIERGQVAVGPQPTRISPSANDARVVYAIWARRSNGVLTVTFFVGGSFPVKHWGYLYSSSGQLAPGSFESAQWPKHLGLRDKWFYISD